MSKKEIKISDLKAKEKEAVEQFIDQVTQGKSMKQVSEGYMEQLRDIYEKNTPERAMMATITYEFPDGRYVKVYFIEHDLAEIEERRTGFTRLM